MIFCAWSKAWGSAFRGERSFSSSVSFPWWSRSSPVSKPSPTFRLSVWLSFSSRWESFSSKISELSTSLTRRLILWRKRRFLWTSAFYRNRWGFFSTPLKAFRCTSLWKTPTRNKRISTPFSYGPCCSSRCSFSSSTSLPTSHFFRKPEKSFFWISTCRSPTSTWWNSSIWAWSSSRTPSTSSLCTAPFYPTPPSKSSSSPSQDSSSRDSNWFLDSESRFSAFWLGRSCLLSSILFPLWGHFSFLCSGLWFRFACIWLTLEGKRNWKSVMWYSRVLCLLLVWQSLELLPFFRSRLWSQ